MSQDPMRNLISPNFSYEKLESPTCEDLIDVFEDRMRNWFLLPATRLLDTPDCQIAAIALLISYFEGIEIYLTGKDSKNKSADFFANGFKRVFSIHGEGRELLRKIADALYSQARCGFAHDGMFRNRVFFSGVRPEPLLITWPKKNGVFDFSGDVESIVINPSRFYESIQKHFDGYVKKLREGSDLAARQAFEAAVKLKWALEEKDRSIGMTEDEFHKT
jgi:hypothetical protein